MIESTALEAWRVAIAVIHTLLPSATEAEQVLGRGCQDAEPWGGTWAEKPREVTAAHPDPQEPVRQIKTESS